MFPIGFTISLYLTSKVRAAAVKFDEKKKFMVGIFPVAELVFTDMQSSHCTAVLLLTSEH